MALEDDVIDWALDDDGDLILVDGDLVWTTGVDAVVQEITRVLTVYQGEWFADLEAGFPYYQEVFVKPVDLARVRARVAEAVLSVENVAALAAPVEVLFDPAIRTLYIGWSAVIQFDDDDAEPVTVSGSVGG